MIRNLSVDFLPTKPLKYPVKIFHGKIQADEQIEKGSFIFILNPEKLNQQELKILFQYNACFIFFKSPKSIEISTEEHPIRLLLNDKDVNKNLDRIKGLQKNLLELYVQKNKSWDFLGITVSYKQLFSIKKIGFCFMEYPIIHEDTMNLDDVFIQEAVKSLSPVEIITKYIQIIENTSANQMEAMNRRNAFQKVFKFYKSQDSNYEFNLNPEDVSFLVDVLCLKELNTDMVQAITTIGALTAACSYFIHAGHPDSYKLIIEKLMLSQDKNECRIKYKYISQDDLNKLKSINAFLYYHLTCRVPNQYTIALFDIFLIESDLNLIQNYNEIIDNWIKYLKRKISQLSITSENLLWEFKRDQEIGAMAGTIGQVTLYKQVVINNDLEFFDEAEKYLKAAIEYAHPNEKSRNINYLFQCILSKIVKLDLIKKDNKKCESKLIDLSLMISKKFENINKYNSFDVMFSICIVSIAKVMVNDEFAMKIYNTIGFDWTSIETAMEEEHYLYSSYLLVAYLLLAPKKLIDLKVDINKLVQKAIKFFKLDDSKYCKKDVIDLIGLKFMLAHACYISNYGAEKERQIIKEYEDSINNVVIFSKWKNECLEYFEQCISQAVPELNAVNIIFKIPY